MSIELYNLSEELKNIENGIFDEIITNNLNNVAKKEYEFIGYVKTTLETKPSPDDEYKLEKNIERRLNEHYKVNDREMFYPRVDELKHYYIQRPYSNRLFSDEESLVHLLTLGLAFIVSIPLYLKRYYIWYTSTDYYAIKYKIYLRRSNIEVIEENN
jgi:hypothetical protein